MSGEIIKPFFVRCDGRGDEGGDEDEDADDDEYDETGESSGIFKSWLSYEFELVGIPLSLFIVVVCVVVVTKSWSKDGFLICACGVSG